MRQSYVRISACCLIACTLIATFSAFLLNPGLSSPSAQAAAPATRIMPLGDSITGSPGCWRALLWNNLQNNGYTNIDFVGTLPPQGCGIPYDGDNEGHGGILVTNMANQNQLPPWLSATNPDIVLMHLGTNDVWSNIATTTILNAYSTLVDQMRAHNPNIIILVAQIIPLNPTGCSHCAPNAIALNAAIPDWASARSTAQSPIIVVDQWTGFDTSTDTSDGVHPNEIGIQKIADNWYAPLAAQLDNSVPSTPTPTPTTGTTPTPTPTPTPTQTQTPTPTPTPGPDSSCNVTYVVQSQWPGGFTANVTITNTGSNALNGWSLNFTFPDASQQVSQGWNATWSQSGSQVTATNMSWNGSLAAGASINIGFNGAFSSNNPVPTNLTLNGTACTN